MENSRKRTRLYELMQKRGLTSKTLAEKYNLSESTVKHYISGKRRLTPEVAIKIANDYNVTLDWLYERSDYMNSVDLMVKIVSVLDKVFRIRIYNGEMRIAVDKKFYDFIVDIQELEKNIKSRLTAEQYKKIRGDIYSRHKDFLVDLFDEDTENEDEPIQLTSIEDLTVLDIFASAMDKRTNEKSP